MYDLLMDMAADERRADLMREAAQLTRMRNAGVQRRPSEGLKGRLSGALGARR